MAMMANRNKLDNNYMAFEVKRTYTLRGKSH